MHVAILPENDEGIYEYDKEEQEKLRANLEPYSMDDIFPDRRRGRFHTNYVTSRYRDNDGQLREARHVRRFETYSNETSYAARLPPEEFNHFRDKLVPYRMRTSRPPQRLPPDNGFNRGTVEQAQLLLSLQHTNKPKYNREIRQAPPLVQECVNDLSKSQSLSQMEAFRRDNRRYLREGDFERIQEPVLERATPWRVVEQLMRRDMGLSTRSEAATAQAWLKSFDPEALDNRPESPISIDLPDYTGKITKHSFYPCLGNRLANIRCPFEKFQDSRFTKETRDDIKALKAFSKGTRDSDYLPPFHCGTPYQLLNLVEQNIRLLLGYAANIHILDEANGLIASLQRELIRPTVRSPEAAEAFDLSLQQKRQSLIADCNFLTGRFHLLLTQAKEAIIHGKRLNDDNWLKHLTALECFFPLHSERKISTLQRTLMAGTVTTGVQPMTRWTKERTRAKAKAAIKFFANSYSPATSSSSTTSKNN